ncbi:MAG: hypothetical protein ACLR4O_12905, partial [Lachnospiraceae bacterium]
FLYVLIAKYCENCFISTALKLEEGEEVVFADSFDAKEKVFAEVQGRKIELSKLTKKKRDAKPEQVK